MYITIRYLLLSKLLLYILPGMYCSQGKNLKGHFKKLINTGCDRSMIHYKGIIQIFFNFE